MEDIKKIKSVMVKVYFRSSRTVEVGTDDDDMPVQDEVGGDVLQVADMDVRDYEDFVERESVNAGEEGGQFKVLVVTIKNNQIIGERIIKMLAEERRDIERYELREEYQDVLDSIHAINEHEEAYGHDLQDDEGRDAVTIQGLEKRLAELQVKMKAQGITFSGGR